MAVIIYISSTYEDLKDQREAVYKALRRLNHDARAMEDYVATDARPLDKCLKDVVAADLYLGIFAWRYGVVPTKDNPQGHSITEREYRHAVECSKPCLIFLLHEDADWKPKFLDAVTASDKGGASGRCAPNWRTTARSASFEASKNWRSSRVRP
ncbi:MAG: DUF4062 domain-containing protein [Burkholderiales bacterium]|nr:DUF4062 domain-containing protein [Burkholderiales bacterium]